VRWEKVKCDGSSLWRTMTRDFRYLDAVYEANSTSNADIREQQRSRRGRPHRIDYVFVRGHVMAASRDVRYSARYGSPRFISDHKGDFAHVSADSGGSTLQALSLCGVKALIARALGSEADASICPQSSTGLR
jgi:hypothetical protein